MTSPSPRSALPLAALVVGAALLADGVGLWQAIEELANTGTFEPWLPGLGGLAVTLAVGRIALALLPAGFPGEHGSGAWQASGGLLATLAASLLLGIVLLPVQALAFRHLGLPDGGTALLLPWLVPLALRVATLPGAAVPGHGPGVPPGRDSIARSLLVATVVLALLPTVAVLGRSEAFAAVQVANLLGAAALTSPTDDPLVGLACLPALAVLVLHGLGALGLATWLRRAGGLLLVATPMALVAALVRPDVLLIRGASLTDVLATGLGPDELLARAAELAPALPRAALAVGGATALALPALLRGDRRAAWLAILGFLSLSWLAPVTLPAAGPALAVAGLVALLLCAPGGLRARLARPLGLALFLAPAIGLLLMDPVPPPEGAPPPTLDSIDSVRALLGGYDTTRFGVTFALIDAAWIVALLVRPWSARPGLHGRPGRRARPELLFLFVAATLSLLMTLALEVLLELGHPWLAPRFVASIDELLLLLLPGGLLLLVAVLGALAPGRTGTSAGTTP